jgi:DNA-binding transcriptional LysR family regulator
VERIEDFQLFLRVHDLGSISAAARSLGLSVAVASQRLARLESGLGVRLFHRSTRKLQLTTEGATFLDQGRALIEDLEALTSSLRQSSRAVTGMLRVSVPAAFGKQYISPLLPRFLARHPQLRLSIDLSDQFRDLAGEGFDLAIRVGHVDDPNLIVRKLATNRRVLCASPAYLRKHGTPKEPQDLRHHECLLLGDRDQWTLHASDGTPSIVKVQGRLRANHGEVVRDAVLAGLGISLHSTWHVCDDIVAGRLRVVLPQYTLPESSISAVMPARRLMFPRVRAFSDFLVEALGRIPPWERKLRK